MVKNRLKKIIALSAAMAMVMAMSSVVFADDDYAVYDNSAKTTTKTKLHIPKTLKVSNDNKYGAVASVAGPGLTYTYAIASESPSPSNGGTTITDTEDPTPHTGTVHAGPNDGVTLTTNSVSFPVSEALNASQAGTANTKHIVASVDLTKFGTQAGIYRYKITETSNPADPSSIGVNDDNAAEVRYLDVYIERDGDSSGLKVKGYVVHTGATSNGELDTTKKTTFDDSTFSTHNVKLTNKVEGSMGDRGNQFPFAGTVVDNGRYFFAKKGSAPTAVDANKINGGSNLPQDLTLAHGEEYYISGLSSVATVTYTETNNTPDEYQVKIDNGNNSLVSSSAVTASGTDTNTKTLSATAVGSSNNVVDNVIFTNTLDSVSPTGVIFRYGAPLLVLAAAGALFVLNRRSKKANEVV